MKKGHSGDELRVILVGYGLSGRRFHAPLITHTRGLRLSAVVTSNPERTQQLATDYPDVEVVGSMNELCRRADEFDLVVIATPTGSHFVQALQVIQSGLDVVIEKPVTSTAADAKHLWREAARRSRQVHVFQNRRWDSDFLSIRYAKESGMLGSPLVLESRMETLRPVHSWSWRNSLRPQDSGGTLLDLGVHLVDQALQLMGPVNSVFARAHAVRRGAEANDFFTIHLTHHETSTSLLVGSKADPFVGSRFKVLGTKALARVQWSDSQEQALKDGRSPSSTSWGEEQIPAAVEVFSTSETGETIESLVPARKGEWNMFYSRVREAITEYRSPPIDLRDVIETMRVLDAAHQSMIEGTSIVLQPVARHGISRITSSEAI